MRMSGVPQAACLFHLLALAVVTAGKTLGPSLPPDTQGLACGTNQTQVTICFPGTTDKASCEYAITNSTLATAAAQACPSQPLFEDACTVFNGLLFIAYGPCQDQVLSLQNTPVTFPSSPAGSPPARSADVKSVTAWLDILGLSEITMIAGLVVRGYAYERGPLPSTDGVDLLPSLEKVGKLIPSSFNNARQAPLTILGASVPPLDRVTDLEGGMLIENTPNINFTGIFGSLTAVNGPIIVAGNNQLTSLEGLEGLTASDILGNLEILSNNLLADISALEAVLGCQANGSTAIVPPTAQVGAIEVLPADPATSVSRCLLTTAEQVCQFIVSRDCPAGTTSTATPLADVVAPAVSPSKAGR